MKNMALSPAQAMTIRFLVSVLVAYVLAKLLEMTALSGVSGGTTLAFWTWLGFVVTTQVRPTLWEGKSTKLFLINALHGVVNLLVIGAIVGSLA